jgi:hypothetical protein
LKHVQNKISALITLTTNVMIMVFVNIKEYFQVIL